MSLIICPECGKEISDRADKCPNCGCPMHKSSAASQTNAQKIGKGGKISGLSIISLIFSILGCTFIVGTILAIIDLCKKDGRKKTCSIIALVICGVWLVIGIVGSTNNKTQSNVGTTARDIGSSELSEEIQDTENVTEHNDTIELSDQVDVTEYSMENSIGDTYYILIVKNNSSKVITLSSNATAKDETGKAIGSASSSEDAVESGQEVCLLHYFDRITDVAEFEYTLSAKEETFYKPVLSDLSIEQSITDDKVVLITTNNGDNAAKFVEAYALFFSGKDLVYYGSTYITDDDSEIKPGATISAEIDSYETFDNVKVYFSGRK